MYNCDGIQKIQSLIIYATSSKTPLSVEAFNRVAWLVELINSPIVTDDDGNNMLNTIFDKFVQGYSIIQLDELKKEYLQQIALKCINK